MSVRLLSEGSSVVVIDDDVNDAASLIPTLEDAGFRAEMITQFTPGQDADAFLASLGDRYDAVVCDHILAGRGNVRFTGAELVCKANRRAGTPLPAVLISSHVNTEQNGAILRWREGIPSVVDKTDASDEVVEALQYTLDELAGNLARERRAFATPIEVLEVQPGGEEPKAKVVVVGWKIDSSVWMPLGPIEEATGLGPEELCGQWLEAEVNCYAKDASDLFYRNIILAPDLPQEWLSA
ncbi:response regulator [Streptomyces sp. 058-1L]|uniref:response regulator n=1 Tax=Streptomyces sp. 058-1L TaxID=2789266 RepID=UPI0039808A27